MDRLRHGISQITQDTLMPLGMVIVLIGGVMWLDEVAAKVKATADSQEEFRRDQIDTKNILMQMNTRLSRIEGSLKRSEHEDR